MGAVLKINHLDRPIPLAAPLSGIRMLLLADPAVHRPTHERDPDGTVVCRVPPGHNGTDRYGVHLAVSDPPAFTHFYGHVLGFTETAPQTFDVAGATVTFSWSPDAVRAEPETSTGFSYLTLQVADVIAAHAAVCARGAVEEAPPSSAHTSPDATISFIDDPDGNRIELSRRPDLTASPSSRLWS